jgi:hypothetical protein
MYNKVKHIEIKVKVVKKVKNPTNILISTKKSKKMIH